MFTSLTRTLARDRGGPCRSFQVEGWDSFTPSSREPARALASPPAIAERRLAAQIEHLRRILVRGPDTATKNGLPQERFHALFVDAERTLVGEITLGQGAASALVLNLRELFGRALGCDAKGMIIAHNHPSGDSRPSRYDIDATCRLATVARALDIELLDHLIFTHSAVHSMRAGENL
ncbi:MAG: JAB domain-containing protein [Erythrobacter sp.]|jgi:DNA repair protein RadC|nr:JAB domain-containing protein [Erythrobacter sp.]